MEPLTLRTAQGWIVLGLLFCSMAVAAALMGSLAVAPGNAPESLGILSASDWFNLVVTLARIEPTLPCLRLLELVSRFHGLC